jgi:aminoglycoside phosphotransferase family enzyme
MKNAVRHAPQRYHRLLSVDRVTPRTRNWPHQGHADAIVVTVRFAPSAPRRRVWRGVVISVDRSPSKCFAEFVRHHHQAAPSDENDARIVSSMSATTYRVVDAFQRPIVKRLFIAL